MRFNDYTGTLTRNGFIFGIEFLATYYSTTFKFFTEDFNGQVELRKKIWYNKFRDFDDKTFENLISLYCDANKFAPQSPTHLLEHARETMKAQYPKAEVEYMKVKKIVTDNGYYFMSNDSDVKKLDPITYEAYKLTESLFQRAFNDTFNEPECRRNFIKVYNEAVEEKISNLKVSEFTLLDQPKNAENLLEYNPEEIARELLTTTLESLNDITPDEFNIVEATLEGLTQNRQFKSLSYKLQDNLLNAINDGLDGNFKHTVIAIKAELGKGEA